MTFHLSGGDFELSVFGEPGKSYALEASTNLIGFITGFPG